MTCEVNNTMQVNRVPPPQWRSGERGFTMLELVMALGVFVIGMAAVVSLNVIVIRYTTVSGEMAVATNLASAALEELQMTPFDTIVGSSVCPSALLTDTDCYYSKTGEVTVGPSYFARTWTATRNTALGVTDIEVSVQWFDGFMAGTNPHNIRLYGRVYPK